MPSARRSGLSATVGLVLVVGLLLVGGSLAVSGGGILDSGGRLFTAEETTAPDAETASSSDGGDTTGGEVVDGEDVVEAPTTTALSTNFGFTCDDAALKDLSKRKWNLNQFVAGSRPSEGYDQVTFELTRAGAKKAKAGTTVSMEWMSPGDAKSTYGAPARVQGNRAIVVTFDGPMDIDNNQAIDSLLLEGQNVEQLRNIQMFDGSDGKVHAVIGMRSDACARMDTRGFKKKDKSKNGRIYLQVERFET